MPSPISDALDKSLKELKPDKLDGAAVALAKRYAKELDEAALVSKQLSKAMRELESLDPDLHDKFLSLAVRIEESAVAANIGPKLLSTLEQLQMTPRARAQVVKGNANVGSAGKSPLDELRERRSKRGQGAHGA